MVYYVWGAVALIVLGFVIVVNSLKNRDGWEECGITLCRLGCAGLGFMALVHICMLMLRGN